MKKILIISYEFFPSQKISAQRWGYMIKYFPNNGLIPYVITNITSDEKNEDNIFRIGKKEIIEKSNYNLNNKSLRQRMKKIKFLKNIKDYFYMYTNDYFSADIKSTKYFKKETIKNIEKIFEKTGKIDYVICSYGPSATIEIAEYIYKKYKIPYIIDFRDMGAIKNNNFIIKNIDKFFENKKIKKAYGVLTVSNFLKEVLEKNYKKEVKVIYNGYEENKENEVLKKTYSKYYYYAGTVYYHSLESFDLFLDYMKKSNTNNKFIIRSTSNNDINEILREKISERNLEKLVIIKEPAELKIAEAEAESSICNIVFEELHKESLWGRGTLTGKFLKLLIRKPPVLFIAREDNDAKVILNNTKKGQLCSDIKEIEDFFNNITNFNGIKNEIEKYSMENQVKKLSTYLK